MGHTCGFGKLSDFSCARSGGYQNQAVEVFWLMFSPLPETLPCFLFFLVISLDTLLCHENIMILMAESICVIMLILELK